MISATDSFIQYLATELAGAPPIHWVRVAGDNPDANRLRQDHLNVTIHGFSEEATALEEVVVGLDLIGADERKVLGWLKTVRNKLLEGQYIPELDYAQTPAVATGNMVFWKAEDVDFTVVAADQSYIHFTCLLSLRHGRF